MKKVVVPSPEEFDSLLQQNIDATKLYVLVVGENVPETGKSWCPDCVKADPLIQKALSNDPEVTLLECPVPRSTYKGNPNHPYRTHKQIQLQGVPTLIRWTKTGPKQRLVEEQIWKGTLLDELVGL